MWATNIMNSLEKFDFDIFLLNSCLEMSRTRIRDQDDEPLKYNSLKASRRTGKDPGFEPRLIHLSTIKSFLCSLI